MPCGLPPDLAWPRSRSTLRPRGACPDGGEAEGHGAMLLFSALVAGSFSLGGRVADIVDPVASRRCGSGWRRW
jgi:hypothetical protein